MISFQQPSDLLPCLPVGFCRHGAGIYDIKISGFAVINQEPALFAQTLGDEVRLIGVHLAAQRTDRRAAAASRENAVDRPGIRSG